MFKLYPKLAVRNLRGNYQITVPYLLSGTGMVMMYYIIYSLAVGCARSNFYGVTSTAAAMELGTYIITILSAIFLFYTNSFVMKRRKKELGLYNILGMEKRHIAGVIFTEALISAFLSLFSGLGLGIIFSKVFFLVMEKLIGSTVPIPFVIPPIALFHAVFVFGAIFFASALFNVLQVKLTKPIELLHGGEIGEKEPKAHWLLAIIGAGLLGAGYYMAVTIEDPVTALLMFFVAVVLVILGTYLLFMVGITAMLKILKKNKGFYYKTRHFTTVSGMLYRMKQNAAGLASICILFTCLLVTVSTTFALYTGVDSMAEDRCPRDISFSFTCVRDEEFAKVREKAEDIVSAHGAQMEDLLTYRALDVGSIREGDSFSFKDSTDYGTIYAYFRVFDLEDYNSFAGTDYTLDETQVLLCDPDGCFDSGTISIFGYDYAVTEIEMPDTGDTLYSNFENIQSYGLVINDPRVIHDGRMYNTASDTDERYAAIDSTILYAFDIAGHDRDAIMDIYTELRDWMLYEKDSWQNYNGGTGIMYSYNNIINEREDIAGLYGAFFFLGLFMGAVFLIGTVLIIYYKQVSEGYEDARRFDIMQKVGMSHQEVKRSIHSQVLLVFFLPLVTAVVHLCFAFPMLRKILMLMSMANFNLILLSMAGCVLLFSVFYMVIYALTARTYYKIVESAN